MAFRRWVFAPLDKAAAADLSESCDIQPFLSLLLAARGITDPEQATVFLTGNEQEEDPFAFADMDAAAERIQRALDNGERIGIFGDYDADGITATVLLYTYLLSRGGNVFYVVPQREGEGYGLSRTTVERLREQGAQLLVTVDNGVSAVDEIAYANELGMDVVVTDHHQPQEQLPAAIAVVDPHRTDCESGFKHFAGVGVAYKLVCALEGDSEAVLAEYADLIAIGTLADVMPLKQENRLLVRAGLRLLNEHHNLGLTKLAEAAGAANRPQTSGSAVFTLAPRINAAGRMGHPEKAAALLLAHTEAEAMALAQEINQLNCDRQQVEADIFAEVTQYIDSHPDVMSQRVLVLCGQSWHSGVVGILAARVLDRYGKPCILLSLNDGVAKGSGRSVPGFSLFDAIASCGDMLQNYGGHQLAAGLSLDASRVEEFRLRINEYAAAAAPDMPVPELRLDFKLPPAQLDVDKLPQLAALEPFGSSNPAPVFGLSGMRVDNLTAVGNGRHTRMSLSRDGHQITAMRFGLPPEDLGLSAGDLVNLAVTIDRNEFRGNVSLSIIVRDLRYADTNQEQVIAGLRLYDRALRRELTDEQRQALLPNREQLAALYRLLRRQKEWSGTPEHLRHLLGRPDIDCGKLLVIIAVLREAGLLTAADNGDRLRLTVTETAEKVDLASTAMIAYLNGDG